MNYFTVNCRDNGISKKQRCMKMTVNFTMQRSAPDVRASGVLQPMNYLKAHATN